MSSQPKTKAAIQAIARDLRAAKRRKARFDPIREIHTYPLVQLTDDPKENPCRSMPYEHVLECGHLVVTALPNAPCGRNCALAQPDNDKKRKSQEAKDARKRTGFHCQACAEEKIEQKDEVKNAETNSDAENARIKLRRKLKPKSLRKAYIGIKVVAVRCDEKGNPLKGYTPNPGHRFDTAVPSIGPNMFEDLGEDEEDEQEKEEPRKKDKKRRRLN